MRDLILDTARELQTHFETMLRVYRATVEARIDAEKRLRARFGEKGRYCFNRWDEKTDIKDVFLALSGVLVDVLGHQLSRVNAGVVPKIGFRMEEIYGKEPRYCDHEGDETLDEFELLVIAHAEKRSLVTLAEHLLERFPPERARSAALQEAADRVRAYFAPPRWASGPARIDDRGRVRVMETSVYWETFESWQMNSGQRNEAFLRVKDMQQLLEEQGLHGPVETTPELHRLWRDGRYSSRCKVPAGTGLTLVLFKDKIEWQFEPSTLDALQIALATQQDAGSPAKAA